MEKLEFKDIHNVIIDFLNVETSNELEIIGYWYFRFLESNELKLSLYLPYYSVEFTKLTFNYIRSFTTTYKLLQSDKLNDFGNTCLFDIFSKSSNVKIDDLTLDFSTKKENIAKWGEDTLTKLDVFLPVFNKEEITYYNKPKTIRTTFELLKSIRSTGILNFPTLIKLDEKMLSFDNIGIVDNAFISENLFSIKNTPDDDYAMEIEEELIAKKINISLLIKYPYSKKPHPFLINIAEKKFNLIFNTRFAYNEILENDIFLLKDETQIKTKIVYSIVDTNHNKKLYELFKSLREQWDNLELNKFTTPFPKYWFLFLNPTLTAEAWLVQFKNDFPVIADQPIIHVIANIIKEIIELKWIDKVIENSPKILFPKLIRNRKKKLEFVYSSFKNYVSSLNQNVVFIDDINSSNDYNNVIILDSFNIIDLANINQCDYHGEIKVIVPDFLYYGYQPWIKYHLFNYQFTPLVNGLRKVLDNKYSYNSEEIDIIKANIIKETKSDLIKYKSKFTLVKKEEIEENPNLEDIEYSNEEEIKNADIEIENDIKSIIINQYLPNEVTILSSEKVLLQKDTLIYIKAGLLNKGDFIIRNSDISQLYKSNNLYNKLVSIPEDILNYQNKLFKFKNVYQILKNKGISYQHKNYFENNYVLEKNDVDSFRIPRRKKDWAIICEFLNINYSEQELSFIAYYGRTKQNELKELYKLIINLLLENNWMGTIEDVNIIKSISNIVNQYNYIFQTNVENEIFEISESIIATILNQLIFTEIKTIKTISNE